MYICKYSIINAGCPRKVSLKKQGNFELGYLKAVWTKSNPVETYTNYNHRSHINLISSRIICFVHFEEAKLLQNSLCHSLDTWYT